jgi:hypothetical protein
MIRFFLLEISAILLYIISILLLNFINIPVQISFIFSFYLLSLMFLIIIAFPSGILLAFTEKYAPAAMPGHAWKTLSPAKKDQRLSLLFVALCMIFGWGTFFLLIIMGFAVIFSLFFAQFILTLIFILFLLKYPPERKSSPNLRPVFVAFFFSLITIVTMIALLQVLTYISTILIT